MQDGEEDELAADRSARAASERLSTPWIQGQSLKAAQSGRTAAAVKNVTSGAQLGGSENGTADDEIDEKLREALQFATLLFYKEKSLTRFLCLRSLIGAGGESRALTVGRLPDCDVVLQEEESSRLHAELVYKKGSTGSGWSLRDLGSTHGTSVNGGKIASKVLVTLEDFDEIIVAESPVTVVFRTAVKGAELAAVARLRRRRPPAAVAERSPKKLRKETVRCKHILLKHGQSRKPFDSYRKKPVTRTRDEAKAQLGAIEAELREHPEKFDDIARDISECSSAKNGGDLGEFSADMMQKPFSDASFALSVGEMSSIVSTDSGEHLIMRTA